jgi:hypothetical protein
MKKSNFLKGCLIAIFFCVLCAGGLYAWAVVSSWLPIDQAAPNLALPGSFTQDMAALGPASIQNVEEVFTIQSSSKPDEIVALYQAMDDLDLLVVHESGLFHRWDLETKSLEAEYDFLAGRRTGVNFNFDGSQVITPGKLVSGDSLYGYSLWDVNTGKLLDCWGDHCPDPDLFSEQFAETGMSLSPNGKWIVKFQGIGISVKSLLRDPTLHRSFNVDPLDYDNDFYTIDQIAFDISGKYFSCAIKEGVVQVYDADLLFDPLSGEDSDSHLKVSEREYGSYDADHLTHTSDLAIDDTRTWLARLTDEELIIYDLRKRFFPRQLKVPISNGNLLAFNHSGNLLAVATDDEILMFDIAKRKQVASFDTGEATALFFTHDDRLLTWGDKDGMIHIWGVSEE